MGVLELSLYLLGFLFFFSFFAIIYVGSIFGNFFSYSMYAYISYSAVAYFILIFNFPNEGVLDCVLDLLKLLKVSLHAWKEKKKYKKRIFTIKTLEKKNT